MTKYLNMFRKTTDVNLTLNQLNLEEYNYEILSNFTSEDSLSQSSESSSTPSSSTPSKSTSASKSNSTSSSNQTSEQSIVSNCTSGTYYNKSEAKCVDCVANCEKCSDGDSCDQCYTYYEYDSTSKRCLFNCLVSNCANCTKEEPNKY